MMTVQKRITCASERTYTAGEAARIRKFGDVANGVAFDWELAGPGGARFSLLREPHHTDEDIQLAARQLKADRDVVGLISICKVEG